MRSSNLMCLQNDIRLALQDDGVSASQIVEIVRETLKMEADKHKATARKAQDALEKLNIPSYSMRDYVPTDSLGNYSLNFDGLCGSSGVDSITF